MSDQKQMGNMLETKHTILDQNPYDASTYVENIFRLQRAFAGRFIPFDQCRKDIKERQKWNLELAACVMDELSEVLNWLPWKHWKKYDKFEWKPEELKFELIDILHFLVNISLVNNFGPDKGLLKPTEYAKPIKDPFELQKRFKPLLIAMNSNLSDLVITSESDSQRLIIRRCFRVLDKMFGLFAMTEQEIYIYYTSKNQENYERQERGY